ncbi:acyl-CoA synthetase [Comamonas serinivorans]|uniref:Acyl-CoA synthetase n=1 Tax=Comamonas serinivorans TaxID=1082851 RepID=A0A1Y0EKP2_9BURK|nr:acyl-CoA synthetase [Comamonas serinivorans]ARU03929.1 acyl-CoA synthetase [Comamonas serinivorans]
MSALDHWARERPDDIAYTLVPSGRAVSWRELDTRSRQLAAAMVDAGLQVGDGIAVMLENHLRYFEILWAAHRIGLYYTPISRHLKTAEMGHIVRDCGAKWLFCSATTAGELDADVLRSLPVRRVMLDGYAEGFDEYESVIAPYPDGVTLPERPEGMDFCYSSGTTGLPKGIKKPLADAGQHFARKSDPRTHWKDFDASSVYLSTAPFYHTAPVRWNMAVMRAGGHCVMMEKFDAELALQAIDQFQVTHGQFVPTMFIRMLRLPDEVKASYDLSSLRYAVHAAAPCPATVKRAMIDWWGPILYEFYSGTELVGRTSLDSHEWLAHPGSVGRAEVGVIHIVGEDGRELPPGENGVIYFSGGPSFNYHNDPEKTRAAYNDQGWATYGDIGHVDAEGYLYLTDRLANTIVSGGVNIYPQETEDVLQAHPVVLDVAVIGVPDAEFGEAVKAVVQLQAPHQPSPELADELIAWCRARISPLKCPRSVDFVEALPRAESGKLLKRLVKAQYWEGGVGIAH